MKRIALIEDDADIAYTIRLNLRKERRYQVEHYVSGLAALAAIVFGVAWVAGRPRLARLAAGAVAAIALLSLVAFALAMYALAIPL